MEIMMIAAWTVNRVPFTVNETLFLTYHTRGMVMAISRDDVVKVAHLARIDLSGEELQLFSKQLESIVEFIDKLKVLDISSLKPSSHVLEIKNVFRPDIAKDSLTKEAVLQNAPKSLKGHFLVPKVIE